MTAVTLPVTRRSAILQHLARNSDLTASELARVIGSGSPLDRLLKDMLAKAQVIRRTGYRPSQGREVSTWSAAPPGPEPPPRRPVPPEVLEHKRARDRRNTAARRARTRTSIPFPGVPAFPGAACTGEDPDLFFPEPGDVNAEAKAVAICADCPVRAACYAAAVQRGEKFGIWGGVNAEHEPRRQDTACGG